MLLKPRADAKRLAEEACDGLVILKAQFGCLGAAAGSATATWIDVTTPCQAFVEDSTLLLHAGPKGRLDGFCDTDPLGEGEQRLRVEYRWRGQRLQAEVADEDVLRIPVPPEDRGT